MKFEVFFLALVFSVAIGCPGENLSPCTCHWPRMEGSAYITCAGLNNEQDLVTAASSLIGKSYVYSFTIKNSVFTFIPSEAFKGLKFTELEVTNSSLMALTDTDVAFIGLENYLEILIMTECTFMNEWDWSILRNLKKLMRLEMSKGDLESIEDLGKINLDNLKDISFEHNRIDFIHDYAFSNCKNLMTLRLDNNRVSEITRTMLPNPAAELMDIGLSSNNIEKFPSDMFTNMPKLEHLSIGRNKILVLDEKVFSGVWSQLETFEAMGNELRCDCRIIWILSKTPPKAVRAICAQPQEVKGKSLSSLSSKDLWCYH